MDSSVKSPQKSSCPYCGNNPVPHFIYWFFESGNVAMTPLRQWLLYNPLTQTLSAWFNRINLPWKLVRIGMMLGIIRARSDRVACKVGRAQVLWEEANNRGIEMQELLLFGRPFDVYVAKKAVDGSSKVKYLVFSGLPRPSGYNNRSLDWMDDKATLKQKFKAAGLPVPAGGAVSSFWEAKRIFFDIQKSEIRNQKSEINSNPQESGQVQNSKPVIVKPREGSRGRHSTVFVSSVNDLYKAFKVAKQLCHWALVERQLFGPVYRATLINYELCGVLRGDPPQVTGDGKNNIKDLIAAKNNRSHPDVKDIMADQSMEVFLSRQGLALNSIPPEGRIVNLSEKVGVNYGGSSSEDFEICHPDNKLLFVNAAKVLGDPIVGFDFIIPDITRSWKEQTCGFIEANSLPFINLHHDPLRGQARNVAAKVWDMIGYF